MKCVGCQENIPDDVNICPKCGRRQDHILLERPWPCRVCSKMNGAERSSCWKCHTPRGG